MRFAVGGMVVLVASLTAAPVEGQVRGFVSASAGVAVSTSDDTPSGSGAGFSAQAQGGIWLSRVALGGEVAQHATGQDRKLKLFGAFFRLPAMTPGPVRPYLVTGLGVYRYGSDDAGHRTSIGGSVGPGALFHIGGPVSAQVEARFHATFDRQPGLNTQQFVAITAGVELKL